MIETRELYQWIKDWADRRGKGLRLSADDRVAVVETIEALRRVAIAADEAWRAYELPEDVELMLKEILVDIPDWWLTEESP